jgi:hypothetical protein
MEVTAMAWSAAERQERIERYARGPDLVRAALERVPEEARRWKPSPERWSVHEIVCHCADAETNAAARIRYVLAEKAPTVVGYDQDEWARALDYLAQPLEPALACIDATRAHTTALIRRLPEAAWAREGRHTESGRYTAEDWLRLYSEHLETHAAQIDRTVQAWRERGA